MGHRAFLLCDTTTRNISHRGESPYPAKWQSTSEKLSISHLFASAASYRTSCGDSTAPGLCLGGVSSLKSHRVILVLRKERRSALVPGAFRLQLEERKVHARRKSVPTVLWLGFSGCRPQKLNTLQMYGCP